MAEAEGTGPVASGVKIFVNGFVCDAAGVCILILGDELHEETVKLLRDRPHLFQVVSKMGVLDSPASHHLQE